MALGNNVARQQQQQPRGSEHCVQRARWSLLFSACAVTGMSVVADTVVTEGDLVSSNSWLSIVPRSWARTLLSSVQVIQSPNRTLCTSTLGSCAIQRY